jgi:hypothetical protein
LLPTLDVQQALSWLPANTETVIVAKDFLLADFAELQKTHDSYTKEIAFQSLALWPLVLKNGELAAYVKGQRVLLAVEGARHFRAPKGFGLMPYEGCSLIAFASDQRDRLNAFFKLAPKAALKVEEIEGYRFRVLQQRSEDDIWTIFVGLPRPNLVLMATDLDYLKEVLSRLGGKSGPRALPKNGPEWQYVDTSAQFWGLRRFDRSGGDRDPSSPFWDPKKVVQSPWTDEQAIGLTFSYDPARGKGPTITYLSGDPSAGREALLLGYEGSKFGVALRELNGRAIQASYRVDNSTAHMFVFFLTYFLGHGIFV